MGTGRFDRIGKFEQYREIFDIEAIIKKNFEKVVDCNNYREFRKP